MKRPDVVAAAQSGGMPDEKFGRDFPQLSEYLTHDKYDDGTARALSALSVKVQDGMILVGLQDHDLERSLFVVGETLAKALAALEKHAGSPTADWRRWGGKGKRKK